MAVSSSPARRRGWPKFGARLPLLPARTEAILDTDKASPGAWPEPLERLGNVELLWLRRRLIVAAGLVTAIVAGVLALALPRKFAAVTTLTTVTSRTGLAVGGGAGLAASLLGAQGIGGVQPTPAFVSKLFRLPGVLDRVATSPAAAGDRRRLIDALERRDSGRVNYEKSLTGLRRIVTVSADPQTGLITVRAVHQDTANLRLVVMRLLADVSETFRSASRAQATELRLAQQARVDSAARRLATARERLVRFTATNRVVAPYSVASLEREQLEQEVRLAETVYTQAVSDREAALAKELEETPALVVVDPLPREFEREPRGTTWKILAGFVLGTFGCAAWLLLRRRVALFRKHAAAL